MVEKYCINCNKKHTYIWRIKYCSEKCYYDFKQKKKLNIIKKCIYCKKDYKVKVKNQKYCCYECRYKHSFLLSKPKPDLNNKWMKLRFEILKRDDFTCQYCGRNPKEDKIKLHIDHIFPKSKGGKDIPENLITSCKDCNIGKSDILLEKKILNKNKAIV